MYVRRSIYLLLSPLVTLMQPPIYLKNLLAILPPSVFSSISGVRPSSFPSPNRLRRSAVQAFAHQPASGAHSWHLVPLRAPTFSPGERGRARASGPWHPAPGGE
jgi:hypothetical protein